LSLMFDCCFVPDVWLLLGSWHLIVASCLFCVSVCIVYGQVYFIDTHYCFIKVCFFIAFLFHRYFWEPMLVSWWWLPHNHGSSIHYVVCFLLIHCCLVPDIWLLLLCLFFVLVCIVYGQVYFIDTHYCFIKVCFFIVFLFHRYFWEPMLVSWWWLPRNHGSSIH
jgi:hypothetical protein